MGLGVHTEDELEQRQPVPEDDENQGNTDVYGLFSAASPSSRVQANVNFAMLLDRAAETAASAQKVTEAGGGGTGGVG